MLFFFLLITSAVAVGAPPQVFEGASCDSIIQSLRTFYYVKPNEGSAEVANIMDPSHPVGDWIYSQVESWNGYNGGCGIRDGYLSKVDLQNYRWYVHLEQSNDIIGGSVQDACYWDKLTCSEGAWEVLGVIRAYQIVCGSIQLLKLGDQRYNIFYCRKDAYDEWQKVNTGYFNPFSFVSIAYQAGIPIVNLPSASGGVEAVTVDDGSLPSPYIDPASGIDSSDGPVIISDGSFPSSELSVSNTGTEVLLTGLITTSTLHTVTNTATSTFTTQTGDDGTITLSSYVSNSVSGSARVSSAKVSKPTSSELSASGSRPTSTSSSNAGILLPLARWIESFVVLILSI
ncbi:CIC11C00000000011 [Sungouiella intermedia]|uniref:CIC11C00000000011 n=1 Tax=Sungouiella intermedia TaxID=45354 RepID=A0A1L0BWJ3_9ASCO|nr:CIC11C00000000011 [[Candida] intermedia]